MKRVLERRRRWVARATAAAALAAATAAWGGQVVSPEERAWARRALEDEKSLAAPSGANTVGVLNFRNLTGDASLDPLQKGLALMLATDLASVDGVEVVERVRVQALVEELKLGKTGLVDEASAPRVGRLLGARWLVGGELSGLPLPRAGVASRVLDVPKGEVARSTAVEGPVDEFFRLEKDLLFDVLAALKVTPTPAQESRLRQPCSRNAGALLTLFRAVEASDQGDYEGAERGFQRALAQDPGICVAGSALRELQGRGLVGSRGSGKKLLRTLRNETSATNQLGSKDRAGQPLTPGAGRLGYRSYDEYYPPTTDTVGKGGVR